MLQHPGEQSTFPQCWAHSRGQPVYLGESGSRGSCNLYMPASGLVYGDQCQGNLGIDHDQKKNTHVTVVNVAENNKLTYNLT